MISLCLLKEDCRRDTDQSQAEGRSHFSGLFTGEQYRIVQCTGVENFFGTVWIWTVPYRSYGHPEDGPHVLYGFLPDRAIRTMRNGTARILSWFLAHYDSPTAPIVWDGVGHQQLSVYKQASK